MTTFLALGFLEIFFAAGLELEAFAAFFTALGLDAERADEAAAGVAFALRDFLPPKIDSQPFAYFSLVPTRVIVTANSLL
ncbi:MAG: hypothetical protein ACK5AC_20630 [Planctomycetota bacterium]